MPRWERRPDERPQELLEAAFRVFTQRGYRATRLEEIAEAAGVTKGTIYYYFDGKEDLFRRVVAQRGQRTTARVQEAVARVDGSVAARLRVALREAWRDLAGPNGALLRLMIGEVSIEAPELFRAWLADGLTQGCCDLAGLIREGQRSGELRGDADADVAARVFVSGILMEALLQQHGADDAASLSLDRLMESATELLLSSLRP